MPLPYRLPTFNTSCDVWHTGTPTTDPPDMSPDCQLYFNSRTNVDVDPTDDNAFNPIIWLRVPRLTDLRVDDTVECPPGSGWTYRVRWTDRVHLGFANEYFVGALEQLSTSPPTPGSGFILMEDSGYVLLESGDRILLE